MPGGTGPRRPFIALNDVVVARGALARVVRLDVAIDGSRTWRRSSPTASSSSTPTGSTGYSFSRRRPDPRPDRAAT